MYTLNPKYSDHDQLVNKLNELGGKIDLGCGYYKPEGFIGLDNMTGSYAQVENNENLPDVYLDLNVDNIPFEDESCSEVRMSHFLEHSNVDHVLSESFRVLKPNGLLMITVPYANSAEGLYPGHNIFFTEKWFYKNINFNKLFFIEKELFVKSDDWLRAPIWMRVVFPFNVARKYFFNSCNEMTLLCRPKK